MPSASAPVPSPRSTQLSMALGFAVTPVILGASALAAPHVKLSDAAVDLATFAGASVTAVTALFLLSSRGLALKHGLTLLTLALGAIVAVGLTREAGWLSALIVSWALVLSGHAIGDMIGTRIEDAGHLLPACIVASAADIASVIHPSGPSHALAESVRALSLTAVSFPVMGTTIFAPSLGAGDLVFSALLLGAARRHEISRLRLLLLILLGIALAGAISGVTGVAVPALPFIGFATIVGCRQARVLRRRDKTVAAIFIVGSLVLALGTIVSKFL